MGSVLVLEGWGCVVSLVCTVDPHCCFRFAHLINVDFFADLMSVLSQLLASGVSV